MPIKNAFTKACSVPENVPGKVDSLDGRPVHILHTKGDGTCATRAPIEAMIVAAKASDNPEYLTEVIAFLQGVYNRNKGNAKHRTEEARYPEGHRDELVEQFFNDISDKSVEYITDKYFKQDPNLSLGTRTLTLLSECLRFDIGTFYHKEQEGKDFIADQRVGYVNIGSIEEIKEFDDTVNAFADPRSYMDTGLIKVYFDRKTNFSYESRIINKDNDFSQGEGKLKFFTRLKDAGTGAAHIEAVIPNAVYDKLTAEKPILAAASRPPNVITRVANRLANVLNTRVKNVELARSTSSSSTSSQASSNTSNPPSPVASSAEQVPTVRAVEVDPLVPAFSVNLDGTLVPVEGVREITTQIARARVEPAAARVEPAAARVEPAARVEQAATAEPSPMQPEQTPLTSATASPTPTPTLTSNPPVTTEPEVNPDQVTEKTLFELATSEEASAYEAIIECNSTTELDVVLQSLNKSRIAELTAQIDDLRGEIDSLPPPSSEPDQKQTQILELQAKITELQTPTTNEDLTAHKIEAQAYLTARQRLLGQSDDTNIIDTPETLAKTRTMANELIDDAINAEAADAERALDPEPVHADEAERGLIAGYGHQAWVKFYASLPRVPTTAEVVKAFKSIPGKMQFGVVQASYWFMSVQEINALVRDPTSAKDKVAAAAEDENSRLYKDSIKNLYSYQIKYMSPKVFENMVKSQVENLQEKHFNPDWSSYSPWPTNILKYIPAARIGDINADIFGKIKPWRIAQMLDKDPTKLAGFSEDQTKKITVAQLNAIINASKKNANIDLKNLKAAAIQPEIIRKLKLKNLNILLTNNIEKMTADQFNGMHLGGRGITVSRTPQIQSIPPNVFARISKAAFAGLEGKQIRALTGAQLNELAKTRAKEFTARHFNEMLSGRKVPPRTAQIKLLDPALFAQLDSTVLRGTPGTSPDQPGTPGLLPVTIRRMTNAQIEQLAKVKIPGTAPPQMAMTAEQINGMNVWRIIPGRPNREPQIRALGLEVANLPKETLQKIDAKQIRAMTVEQMAALDINALTGDQVRSLKSSAFALMKKEKLEGIGVEQISVMNLQQMNAYEKAMNRVGATVPTETKAAIDKYKSQSYMKYGFRQGLYYGVGVYRLNRMNKNDVELAANDPAGNKLLHPQNIPNIPYIKFYFMKKELFTYMNQAQINALTADQFNSWLRNILVELKPAQIKDIKPEIFGKIHSKYTAKMKPDQIGALTFDQMAKATSYQINRWDDDQIKSISPDAIGGIATDIIPFIKGEKLNALEPKQVAKMTAAQFNAMHTGGLYGMARYGYNNPQISHIKPECIAAIPPGEFAKIDAKQISCLGKEQIAALTAKQVSAMTRAQMRVIDITAIRPEVLAKLVPAEKIANFKYAQIKKLDVNQVLALTPEHLEALAEKSVFVHRAPPKISGSTSLLRAIKPEIFAGITAETLNKCDVAVMKNISKAQIAEMKVETINDLDADHLQAIPPGIFAKLPGDKFKDIAPKQIALLTADKKNGQIQNLSVDQMGSMTNKQAEALTAPQLQVMKSKQYNAMQPGAFQALNKEQIQKIKADAIAKIDITKFSPKQIGFLTAVQLNELKPGQFKKMSLEQAYSLDLVKMKPAQLLELAKHLDRMKEDYIAQLKRKDPNITFEQIQDKIKEKFPELEAKSQIIKAGTITYESTTDIMSRKANDLASAVKKVLTGDIRKVGSGPPLNDTERTLKEFFDSHDAKVPNHQIRKIAAKISEGNQLSPGMLKVALERHANQGGAIIKPQPKDTNLAAFAEGAVQKVKDVVSDYKQKNNTQEEPSKEYVTQFVRQMEKMPGVKAATLSKSRDMVKGAVSDKVWQQSTKELVRQRGQESAENVMARSASNVLPLNMRPEASPPLPSTKNDAAERRRSMDPRMGGKGS